MAVDVLRLENLFKKDEPVMMYLSDGRIIEIDRRNAGPVIAKIHARLTDYIFRLEYDG